MEGGIEEPPMHIESPYRPDEPAAKRKPKPRLQLHECRAWTPRRKAHRRPSPQAARR